MILRWADFGETCLRLARTNAHGCLCRVVRHCPCHAISCQSTLSSRVQFTPHDESNMAVMAFGCGAITIPASDQPSDPATIKLTSPGQSTGSAVSGHFRAVRTSAQIRLLSFTAQQLLIQGPVIAPKRSCVAVSQQPNSVCRAPTVGGVTQSAS